MVLQWCHNRFTTASLRCYNGYASQKKEDRKEGREGVRKREERTKGGGGGFNADLSVGGVVVLLLIHPPLRRYGVRE
jgi:hypothetical protein